LAVAVLATGLAVGVAACGSDMSGMQHGTMTPTPGPAPTTGHSGMDDMPGMDGTHQMFTGDGLSATLDGVRFAPTTMELPAGTSTTFAFTILASDGAPITAFEPDQTKLMHFYLIRSDLTGFQHLHPTMAPDGTWTAGVSALQPGAYRAYASFVTRDAEGRAVPRVLSDHVRVAGQAKPVALPKASATTTVDGYTLTVSGRPMAGMSHTLEVRITRDGKPVTDLEPYLDTFAHLTAFHEGDLAFAHLHPGSDGHGGPTLSFQANLAKAGNWRLFLQFQTGGVVHTAAVTLAVA
jgi:hypothetical protein